MMAITVLGLGAAGVIGMQKATLFANTNSRNLATANGIAQAWMERLRADSLAWNGPADLTTDTQWLQGASNTPAVETGWFTPASSTLASNQPAGVPIADMMGADLFPGDTSMAPVFCTQIRLTRFNNNLNAAALTSYFRLIRAEVRVVWQRDNQAINCATLPAGFDQRGCAYPNKCAPGDYGIVYLVSAVSQNQAPDF
jgi:hypothetical protein